jgi:hypothetical protein
MKTPDIDESAHGFPAVMFHKPGKHGFQGDAMKRILRFVISHCLFSWYLVVAM